jgi:tetratricopeptide (TPR) repeat protein
MRTVTAWCVCLTFTLPVGAQADGSSPPVPADSAKEGPRPAAKHDGREALAGAKRLVAGCSELSGDERSAALDRAAAACERAATDFAGEPEIAGPASFLAAELRRRGGGLAAAERHYLQAAAIDPGRYGQRGVLGAADMQRRQGRLREAMANYELVVELDPTTGHAQKARLARAKLLRAAERLDDSLAAFRQAVETARTGPQVIEASNLLALSCIDTGDLDAAAAALARAGSRVAALGVREPGDVERLRESLAAMSARKALQRARDQRHGTARDAVEFDQQRRRE